MRTLAAMNWPKNRGMATAFPLSAFGLSAFFFSTVSHVVLPGDTGGFLLFLSLGTFVMIAGSSFFVRILPQTSAYTAVPTAETDSRPMWKPQPESAMQLGMSESPDSDASDKEPTEKMVALTEAEIDTHLSDPLEIDDTETHGKLLAQDSLHADVKGWALLRHTEFYQLFLLLGSMTGIGLMTIK